MTSSAGNVAPRSRIWPCPSAARNAAPVRRRPARLQAVWRVRSAPAAAVQGADGGGSAQQGTRQLLRSLQAGCRPRGKARPPPGRMPRDPSWKSCSGNRPADSGPSLPPSRLSSLEKRLPPAGFRSTGLRTAESLMISRLSSSDSVEAPRISSVESSGVAAPGAARVSIASGPLAHHHTLAGGLAGNLGLHGRGSCCRRCLGGLHCRLRGRLVFKIALHGRRAIVRQQFEALQVLRAQRTLCIYPGRRRRLSEARRCLHAWQCGTATGRCRAPCWPPARSPPRDSRSARSWRPAWPNWDH